jgi:hypothetical protein
LPSAAQRLRDLEREKTRFDDGSAARKIELVRALARSRLANAGLVLRFHECLCFLRAYPDDMKVLSLAEAELARFAVRPDLRRHRAALADSGVAGTPIRFAFFEPTADWLARRFPGRLRVDWPEFEQRDRLERMLELLVRWSETPALDEGERSVRAWIETLKGPRETDGDFLVRRVESLRADPFVRQRMFEELDVPFVLEPGPGAPSRTLARHRRSSAALPRRALRRERPDLPREVRIPPRSIRSASPAEAGELVDLAREAMVTRSRDLDAFMFADPRDVRLVDCGGGLQFACLGVRPERRLLLEAVYGFLTLQNGVPIGYVLASALMRSCEVAFNVFESFRGGESGHVYARALSMCRALFRADTFTVYPYQLGHENDEGLRSGAYWFYAKLGFRPRERGALALLRRELERIRRREDHRSTLPTLRALAQENVYWSSGRRREDVIGCFPLGKIGEAAIAYLAERFGSDRERGESICAEECARILSAPSWRRWPASERQAFLRWAPLARILPGSGGWSAPEKRALARVMRAKGGHRESDYVRLFDGHASLRRALGEIAGVRARGS